MRFAEGRVQPEDERALLEHYPAVGTWSSGTPAGAPGEMSVIRSAERLDAGSPTADPAAEQSRAPGERVLVLSEEERVVTLRTAPYAQARLVIEVGTVDVPVAADVRIERVPLLHLPSGTLAPRAQ